MKILCLPWAFVILAELTMAQSTDPPEWTTPPPAVESFTKTSSQCSDITELTAESRDGSGVVYSLVSQNPAGGFAVGVNIFGTIILTCTQALITATPYEVEVSAKHDGGNNLSSNRTFTINFSDQVTGPTWSSGTSFSLDKSDCTVCDPAATLSASSSDSTSVTYSLVSQSPDGGFSVSGNTLSCTYASITQPSHTVVVSAQNTGNGGTTDQTLTIAVTAASGGGPSWSTETSYTVNKGVSIDCSPAVSLSATSSDCSSVAFSFVSESSSGGFSVTGSTLSCTLASLIESSYTVVVRATNTGDGVHTDHTLSITVTSGGSGGSDSGDTGNNETVENSENNEWKYGVGFGVPCGIAFLAGSGLAAYKGIQFWNGRYRLEKVLPQNTPETVSPEENKVNLNNDTETPTPNTDEKAENILSAEAETV